MKIIINNIIFFTHYINMVNINMKLLLYIVFLEKVKEIIDASY